VHPATVFAACAIGAAYSADSYCLFKIGAGFRERKAVVCLETIVFRGVNILSLDSKGRIAIPAKYRAELTDSCEGHLIVTVDKGQCLLMYPRHEWESVEEKLMSLPSINEEIRNLQRLLVGHATEVDMDGNGRALLPPPLRKYAKLEKQVVLLGQGNKFEIWDEEIWNSHCADWLSQDRFEGGLPDQLANFSF